MDAAGPRSTTRWLLVARLIVYAVRRCNTLKISALDLSNHLSVIGLPKTITTIGCARSQQQSNLAETVNSCMGETVRSRTP